MSAAAARNNALWCDTVCRSHGIETRFTGSAWIALRRSPPLYPDAVTLHPDARVDDLLAMIDSSPGCSIKDSFATLDLAGIGFRILFDAQWIHRSPRPHDLAAAAGWRDVRTLEQLHAFAAAHGGDFRPALLDDPAVTVLARDDGDALVAGAIANRTGEVVGVSNVFSLGVDSASTWAGLVAALAPRHPGRALVGYEAGADLAAAQSVGFTVTGPLRVWLRD